jgi:lipopolysaccharide transport system permease protein
MSEALGQHVRIRPMSRWAGLGARELWEYRELAYFLAKRDLQVRYKQTALGALWALAQPLALTGIFALIMGRVVDIDTGDLPYFLVALTGVTVWSFVSSATTGAAASLVTDANLLSKVYFPRLLLPLAKVTGLLVDAVIAATVMIILAAIFGHPPTVETLTLPLWLGLAFIATAGIGIAAASINVRYRDVMAVMPLAVLVWLFITPVAYPGTLVPETWQLIYAINPIATAITGVRYAVVGTEAPDAAQILISVGVTTLITVCGVISFRRNEARFADII